MKQKHFRRRAYARAAGLNLKRVGDNYKVRSKLSVVIFDTALGTAGDRDDTVINLVAQLRPWSYNKRNRRV